MEDTGSDYTIETVYSRLFKHRELVSLTDKV